MMSKEVQALFTSIAPRYDFVNRLFSLSIDRRWRDKAVSELDVLKPKILLDLCAGTLDLSEKISKRFPSCSVIAADFSLAMLQEGEKKLAKGAAIFRVCADGHQLPFPPSSFDAVICGFGIRNLEERDRAVREIRRLLRPQGRLVILEFFRPANPFAKVFYRTYGRWLMPRLGGAISRNRSAYDYLLQTIQSFMTIDEYRAFLKKYGFEEIKTQALSGGIAHLVTARG